MPTFVHPLLLWGLPIIALAGVDPLDQHDAASARGVGGDGVPAGQPEKAPHLDHPQAISFAADANGGDCGDCFLVAQPLLRHQWGSLLGGTKTHHVILLDDSFSMSDHWDDTTAFAEAKQVIERIGAEAARQVQPQVFTLLPFSHARRHHAAQNDLVNYRVGNDFAGKLAETLKKIDVSQTNAGPAEALRTVNQLLGEPEDERRILYIISDFRAKQWNDPADVKKILQEWQAAETEKIHLVNCVDQVRPNLAIDVFAA